MQPNFLIADESGSNPGVNSSTSVTSRQATLAQVGKNIGGVGTRRHVVSLYTTKSLTISFIFFHTYFITKNRVAIQIHILRE